MTQKTVVDRLFGIRPSLRAPAVFLIAFALFTTYVPCRYSSRGAVARALGFETLHAQGGGGNGAGGGPCDGACDCYQWDTVGGSTCFGADGCAKSSFGCSTLWLFPCNACSQSEPPRMNGG